ncbi:hypothetical protein RIF29_18167 [Crotalaria pallida]|uniref:C2 domain-containing protein n=1 Tax=Crotalaria pallida TaxID=3830 RepID=A0AAN9FQD2_CROPI
MTNQKVDFKLKDISPRMGAKNGGITSTTDLVEITLFLFVRIVRARGLHAYGPHGCHPYVELKIGKLKGTTLCFSSSFNPEWNQVFAFDKGRIQIQDATLEMTMKDNMVRFDEFTMGGISLAISDIPTRFPTDSALAPQWYGLQDQKGQRCSGELMLSCWVGTQADEAFHEACHLDAASIGVYNIDATRSQIYIMPRIWCLRVNLVQAKFMVLEENKTEYSQILIQVTLGDLTLRSKVVKINNGNPKWNEDLLFVVAEPIDQKLVFSLEQVTESGHKKSLGACVFPVKNADRRIDGSPASTTTIEVKQNEGFVGRLDVISLDGGYHIFDEDPQCSSDLNPTAKKLSRPVIGVFEMGILSATGLPAVKAMNHTDAYCVAKYGPKWVRTRTVVSSLAPKWNEQYSWDVYDPCTFITVSVFDNCQLHEGDRAAGSMDTRIGKVRIRLSELEFGRIYSNSYPLIQLQPSGLKRMGEIQLAFRCRCFSTLNLCKVYMLPMLPRLHFTIPLSPTQCEALRKQTIAVVSSHMSKTEPPLRREVVEYMLDSRERMWSLRRGRADFERINILMSGLVALYTRFDEARKWKDGFSLITICVLLFGVIFHPPYLLFTMFGWLIINVGQQYQKRPRQLSHLDLQLSHVYTASVDELEEEFDPIPSRFEDHIIRNRYDRLRITAGKYIALMGRLATRGEKLQSLLSWQDPIATMLILFLCLLSGIVTFIVPFRVTVIVFFLYLLRHPIFRSPLPSFLENWVSRMPSKLDSMII